MIIQGSEQPAEGAVNDVESEPSLVVVLSGRACCAPSALIAHAIAPVASAVCRTSTVTRRRSEHNEGARLLTSCRLLVNARSSRHAQIEPSIAAVELPGLQHFARITIL